MDICVRPIEKQHERCVQQVTSIGIAKVPCFRCLFSAKLGSALSMFTTRCRKIGKLRYLFLPHPEIFFGVFDVFTDFANIASRLFFGDYR